MVTGERLAEPTASDPAPILGDMTIQRMIEDTLARLRPHGAELVGEVARYEDSYLLCYLRGPSGIILALAEQLS